MESATLVFLDMRIQPVENEACALSISTEEDVDISGGEVEVAMPKTIPDSIGANGLLALT